MQMPRNGFDSLAAVARLNTDNTMHHRKRWPSLAWVWDELDELRRWQDEALETERNALSEAAEQRDALSEAVRLLLEPEPDMERVQDILMGGW
jgi:chromosome condensin MukBEF ATPase and DNA-binding subunit MukB